MILMIGGVIYMKKSRNNYISDYEKCNYDRILVRFPKGTKELIKHTGQSLNSYIVNCVIESLNKEDF